MVHLQSGAFNGLPCLWLSNGRLRLAVTTARGPRVLFCGLEQGENLFAELPDLSEETPHGTFHFLGGHRLWYAPESRSSTYYPDERAVTVTETAHGARFAAPADGNGIVKEVEIILADGKAEADVSHVLRNTGGTQLELAPWALTMLRMGGIGLYPQPQEPADPDGFLPNKQYVFWPYSDPSDSRLELNRRLVLLWGRPGSANKFGYRNQHGWIGYWLDGTLFTIRFAPVPNAVYPDFGCNVESFVKEQFLELETLGPLVQLAPGDSVVHNERWQLFAGTPPLNSEGGALAALEQIGLWP